MDIWKWLRKRKTNPSNSTLSNPASWLIDWIRGSESDGDVSVTTNSALSYAPIWYAVNKIAGFVGQLPCILYQQLEERQKVPARRHPGYRMMKLRPNPWMTPPVFRETLTAHALLNGNGRAFIERNNRQEVQSLIPLLPDRTITVVVNDEKWHVTTDPQTGEKTKFQDNDVLHIVGLSYDGMQGYSVIEKMRNSVGLGLAGEKQGNRHFRNNSTPGLVLEAPPGVFAKEEDARKFLADWNKYHSGAENANKTALLRNGIKATTLSFNARDSQWIEQRKFQRQEAALWMLLESILGDDESVSYNSLEQKYMAFTSACLSKWLTKWEYELNDKLLTQQQFYSESHFFKFKDAALLRATAKERYEVYEKARMMKVMSANDVRDYEDMNAIDGGDIYENPAIAVSQPDVVDSETDSQDSASDQPSPSPQAIAFQPKALISSRIKEILTVEAHRVEKAAETQKNFVSWVDGFYSDSEFGGRIASVYRQIGSESTSETHIESSLNTLLEIAGASQPDNLKSNIIAVTSTWTDRADALAEQVLTAKVLI